MRVQDTDRVVELLEHRRRHVTALSRLVSGGSLTVPIAGIYVAGDHLEKARPMVLRQMLADISNIEVLLRRFGVSIDDPAACPIDVRPFCVSCGEDLAVTPCRRCPGCVEDGRQPRASDRG